MKRKRKWKINPAWKAVPYQEIAFIELGKDGIWRQGIRRSRREKSGKIETELVSSSPMLNPPMLFEAFQKIAPKTAGILKKSLTSSHQSRSHPSET